jgi:integrase
MNDVPNIESSNSPAALSRPANMAELIAVTHTWTHLSDVRRSNLASSLRTISRIIGMPPETIALEPAALSAAVTGQPSQAFGLSPKRHQNVVTDLRCAMRLIGLILPRPQKTEPERPWRAVLDLTRNDLGRIRLRKFAAFCEKQQVLPGEVTEETFEHFAEHRGATEIVSRRKVDTSHLIRVWNGLVAAHPNLALPHLQLGPRSMNYTFPEHSFAGSFIDDLDNWCKAASRGDAADIFADLDTDNDKGATTPARPRRASSVKLRRAQIIAAASALRHLGWDQGQIRSLKDLVENFGAVKNIAKFHYDRRTGSATTGVFGILEVLRQVAKYHVGLAPDAVQKITALRNRVRPNRDGIAPRNRERLRMLQDPNMRAALLHLPAELMRRAPQEKHTDRQLRLAACAVALEILIICPLRISNVVGLRLDQHFRRAPTGKRHLSHIVIAGSEVKNATPVDWPIPSSSLPILNAWIENYRPRTESPGSPWLFPGKHGKRRDTGALRVALTTEITRFTGLHVHPHLMRHFAATLYLQHNPGQFEQVRRVLGHRSLQTTIDSYMPVETDAAARRFDDVVMKERSATRTLARGMRICKSFKHPTSLAAARKSTGHTAGSTRDGHS